MPNNDRDPIQSLATGVPGFGTVLGGGLPEYSGYRHIDHDVRQFGL